MASGHLDLRLPHALLGAQAEIDLLRERDVERVALHRSSVVAALPVQRSERRLVAARRGAGERDGSQRGVAGGGLVEPPFAGEAPGAVDEDADADALALAVAEVVDLAVLRDHELPPERHRARVGVGGPSPERRINRCLGQRLHPEYPKGVRPLYKCIGSTSLGSVGWWTGRHSYV